MERPWSACRWISSRRRPAAGAGPGPAGIFEACLRLHQLTMVAQKRSSIFMTDQRDALIRRALFLEYITISWNILEGVVAIGAGLAAGSIALVSFGLDSGIEVAAALAIVHRFRTRTLEKQD